MMLLEIAAFTLESAIRAAAAGADRIELCENPHDGGTTPSFGTLKAAVNNLTVPVFPIVRPRGGDFLYTSEEFAIIKTDVELCKRLGYGGIVTGFLNAGGFVERDYLTRIVEIAYPMEVTFHRAFDRCKDPEEALETIIHCGCSRVLTSGQRPVAEAGKQMIRSLVKQADDRIIIMPGSGIRADKLKELIEFTKAVEFHSSARRIKNSAMIFEIEEMQEKLQNIDVDEEEIAKMKNLLLAYEY